MDLTVPDDSSGRRVIPGHLTDHSIFFIIFVDKYPRDETVHSKSYAPIHVGGADLMFDKTSFYRWTFLSRDGKPAN